MEFDGYISKKELLHAYVFEGDIDSIVQEIQLFLSHEIGLSLEGNPDVQTLSFDTFGIDDARLLIEAAALTQFGGSGKFFIVSLSSITREAQNALLKILEEPNPGTHFFLIVPNKEILLSTLRSRLFEVPTKRSRTSSTNAEDFFASLPQKRLAMLEEIVGSKDKRKAVLFLDALEAHMHTVVPVADLGDFHNAFESLREARMYLSDRAPSVKMLLERVALSLPLSRIPS